MSETEPSAAIEPQSTASSSKDSSAPKRLYTVQEAAAKLNLAPSWLYARTGKNEIPFRRFGKYIRFTDDDLEAMIVSGAHQSDESRRERSIENARPARLRCSER
jgi:excisionase family DNA binding protein